MLHDSQMYGVTGGQVRVTEDNPLRALQDGATDSQYVVDDTEQSIKCWLNGVTAIDGNVTVQNLLEDFGIGDETFACAQ